ncbi:TraB/GumN family protein [Pontibacter actiniarum]|uniref:TraB/GumN family protein n=1 Tax=Pontibacter actiniarum TaxID=323450 RepID=A0A1X9YWQ0_9BACT|nr:TraB/GumN family protein [Pontibacter actiniarum]ARS37335.1 TraB/GumN family protein [Pontibacter actiniarum]
MKRTQNLLLTLLLVLAHALPALAGGNKVENALLWQISGNGLQKPSYLYGTIHAVCPERMVLPEALQEKMRQTEQLTLELDMDDPHMMAQMMQFAVLPEGQSLRAMFSEEEYNLLLDYFSVKMGVNLLYMDNMKPFILQTMLLANLTDCTPASYEQKLMELAHAQQKEVLGIETIKEQMDVVDMLPNDLYADMLVRTVRDIPRSKAAYHKMVDLYLAQDLKGLEELMKQDYTEEDYRKFKEVFLVRRNEKWIPVLEQMAKDKPTFFAVGAGHLTGENGVVALLRRQGYKVTPVNR